MERFSPKIEIINHFDNLINRVDIEIEKSLEKSKDDEFLSQCKRYVRNQDLVLRSFSSAENNYEKCDTVYLWSESTKVVDYLNQVRMRTIEELRKEQNNALEYYKSNFKNQLKEGIKIEDFKSQLFGEKFYFQVFYETSPDNDDWIFNLFTICVDFYMTPEDIGLLDRIINFPNPEINMIYQNSNYILDEKVVLINLIYKKIIEYRETEKFPSQIICVRKEDILDIYSINFNHTISDVNLTSLIDLSKLKILQIVSMREMKEIKIENLSSLKRLCLAIESIEQIKVRNLSSLQHFNLELKKSAFNSEIIDKFVESSPNIEYLRLVGDLSYFNLDNLVGLNTLNLKGKIHTEEFNFDLFKDLCNHLTSLNIRIDNFDDICLEKLFYGLYFPHMSELVITYSKITKLEKRFFDGFPTLQTLTICDNRELKKIDNDSFLNLKQLRDLDLSYNLIESPLEKGHFSELTHLETLDLSRNRIKNIEDNIFTNQNNLKKLDLSDNQIENVNPKSFLGLRNLKELNLDSNKLRYFDQDILDNMNKLKKLNLSFNSISNYYNDIWFLMLNS